MPASLRSRVDRGMLMHTTGASRLALRLRQRARASVPGLDALLRRMPAADGTARRVASNSGWLMGERVLRLGVSFFIATWVVRYLGPSDYGVLAYGLSLVLMVDAVSTLGMRSVVVRDLVEHPERESEIIGTAIAVRFAASSVAAALILGLVAATEPDSRTLGVVAVLAAGLPLNALVAIDLSFQSRLQSQYTVVARFAGILAASVLRVVLLLTDGPLIGFAVAGALDLAVAGLGHAVMYARKVGRLFGLRVRGSAARALLSMSWPFFISTIAATIYFKIDRVMLANLSGSTETGIYAAAARLSELWYFVPGALASSMMPVLVSQRLNDVGQYRRTLRRTFSLVAWMAIALAVGTMVVAGFVIDLLYTSEFSRSASILRIHLWSAPFIFMSIILGRAFVTEDRRALEAGRHVLGALVNVGLNLVLIPRYGGEGAAVATLASYAIAGYLICGVFSQTRTHLRLMTEGVLLPIAWLWRRRARERAGVP